MPIVGIREMTAEAGWRPSGDTIGESINIISVSDSEPDTYFSEWDFSEQEAINIEFEYTPSAGFGNVTPIKGRIKIRTGSGLLFVVVDSENNDPNDVDQVIRSIRKNTNDSLKIKKRLVLGREPIWRFVLAGKPVRIDVVTPFGGVQRISLQKESSIPDAVTIEDAEGNYPVDSAEVEFTRDSYSFDIRYFEDKLTISSDNSSDVEYIIQVFESALR